MSPAAEVARLMSPHPVVGFVGPFGTGKTEVAIGYSLAAAATGAAVWLVDLDIVTPYFRVGDYREALAARGLRVIAPEGVLASSETPALSPEIGGALQAEGAQVVLDVGGDPAGAGLLGVYAPRIAARGYDLWLVVNPFRPASSAAEGVAEQRRRIEEASGLGVSGIVANPHLGPLTDASAVAKGLGRAAEIAAALDLPVVFAAVAARLAAIAPELGLPVLSLGLLVRLPWERDRGAGASSPMGK